jgi:hypothetical protein
MSEQKRRTAIVTGAARGASAAPSPWRWRGTA